MSKKYDYEVKAYMSDDKVGKVRVRISEMSGVWFLKRVKRLPDAYLILPDKPNMVSAYPSQKDGVYRILFVATKEKRKDRRYLLSCTNDKITIKEVV
jgi:hypothetical protein